MDILQPMRGKITAVGAVHDKEGNLKGTFVIEGETPLTEEELRARLGDDVFKAPPKDQEEKD